MAPKLYTARDTLNADVRRLEKKIDRMIQRDLTAHKEYEALKHQARKRR